MTQADRIRQFVVDQFIAPARQQGRTEVVIRAGDVHQQMSLTNAMPAVCSAIGSSKFEHLAGVTKTGLRGPSNGANAYFTFNLSARPSAIMVVKQREAIPTSRQSQLKRNLDLAARWSWYRASKANCHILPLRGPCTRPLGSRRYETLSRRVGHVGLFSPPSMGL